MSTSAHSLAAAIETYRLLKGRALSAALAAGCRTPTEAVRYLFPVSKAGALRQLAEARLRAPTARRGLSPA